MKWRGDIVWSKAPHQWADLQRKKCISDAGDAVKIHYTSDTTDAQAADFPMQNAESIRG